jgi:hypothetical protein
MIPPGAPVFKAMKVDDLESMRVRFVSICNQAAGDDYYYSRYQQKRNPKETGEQPKPIQRIKIERYEGFTDSEVPVLGGQRLRRTMESQPLITDPNVEINYILPFEQNDLSMNKLWQILIQLEDLLSQPKPNQMTINSYVRYCIHFIQLDITSKFDQDGKPENHKNLVYFLNNENGRKFLIRFLDMLPQKYMKRFFFTTFIVLKDVNVEDTSDFAIQFMTRLSKYLLVAKPRWVVAYIREITRCGFNNLVKSRFKLASTAMVLSCARKMLDKLKLLEAGEDSENATDQLMLHNALQAFVSNLEKDRGALLPVDYDVVFMRIIIRTAISVCTSKSKLLSILCQTTQ